MSEQAKLVGTLLEVTSEGYGRLYPFSLPVLLRFPFLTTGNLIGLVALAAILALG